MNTDKDDAIAIVAHLCRIVARNSAKERSQLAAEICQVLCGELGLNDVEIGMAAMTQARGMVTAQ